MAEVFHQIFQFPAGQRVVGLDRVTADGLSDGLLAKARGIDLVARGFELVQQLQNEAARIGGLDERRQRIQQEGSLAKFAQADAKASKRAQLLFQEHGVARR